MESQDCQLALSIYISLTVGFVIGLCYTKIHHLFTPRAIPALGPAPTVCGGT